VGGFKLNLRDIMRVVRAGLVEGSCEYSNESSVSYNVGKFFSNCIIGDFSKGA
jgi:hypothetical protein